jgi:hypothetical protein
VNAPLRTEDRSMRVESVSTEVQALRIFDAPKLDPVFVVLHDAGAGCGRLVIECYGRAWSAWWGAMGDRRLRQFITDCGADYLVARLAPGDRRLTKREESYLTRIVQAVQEALR